MVEWVEPPHYEKWRIKFKKPELEKKKPEKKQPEKKPTTKTPETTGPPPKEIEPRRPLAIGGPGRNPAIGPGHGEPPGLDQAPPVRPLGQTVAQREAGREELGAMVRDLMRQRDQTPSRDQTQHGEVLDWGRGSSSAPEGTGSIYTGEIIPNRALPSGPDQTARIPRVGADAKDTQAINRISGDTKPIPRVNSEGVVSSGQFQALGPARADARSTAPIQIIRKETQRPISMGAEPVRSTNLLGLTQHAEPFGQMSLFQAPRDRGSSNLSAAQHAPQEQDQQTPPGLQPGRQVAAWNVNPQVNKAPGSQGTMFTPRRYR